MNEITAIDTAIIFSALGAQTLKEIGFPFPGVSQGALMYAGWQIATGNQFSGLAIILSVFAGCLLGASAAYWSGRFGGNRIVDRFGKRMGFTAERLEQIKNKIEGRLLPAIIAMRLVLLLKVTLSLSAGILRIPYVKYLTGVVIAMVAWEILYVSIGVAGQGVFKGFNLPWHLGTIPTILIMIAAAIIIRISVILIVKHLKKQKG